MFTQETAIEVEFKKFRRQYEFEQRILGMKRAWQERGEDNVASGYPLILDLYIPPDTKVIKQARLRIRLKAFRAYSTGAASGGDYGTTTQAGGGQTVTSHMSGEEYGVLEPQTGETQGHRHSYLDVFLDKHAHSVEIPSHQHWFAIPAHTHNIIYNIYTGTTASAVTVTINNVDVTSALGGPFNTDQPNLDIQPYLTPTGWNTISLGSATLGRIHGTVFVELYLP